jgi:hypothetical protein
MTKKIRLLNKEIQELNNQRKYLGLKELKYKTKKCCKCGCFFKTMCSDICCDKCRYINNKCFNFYGGYGEEME